MSGGLNLSEEETLTTMNEIIVKDKSEQAEYLGTSGCGKSSLLNVMAGYRKPSEGRILLGGEAFRKPSAKVGVVFQYANLFPWLSVYKNVEFGLKQKGMDRTRRKEQVEHYLDDTEMMIGAKVAYDMVSSSIVPAEGWKQAPGDALEFTILLCKGEIKRPALILKGESGAYDKVQIYESKAAEKFLVELKAGEMKSGIVDDAVKNGRTKKACRSWKLLTLTPDGARVKLWVSNALDVENDTLWQPKSLYKTVTENVGPVPPVSLIGGEDEELAEEIFLPSWEIYNKWQADSLKYLIDREDYEIIFSHLHNVDCAGHQFWHLAKTLKPWKHTDEKFYQKLIEKVYEQTDEYLGEFYEYLDKGWDIFIVSDHGLLVGENVPPILGEYGGLNLGVMEELGYTVRKKDEDGNPVDEIDWEKTRAVQIRSNYIYINLKGRDKYGIVEEKEKYDLEEQIISDLYSYRDQATGKRVVGIAMRNKDSVVLGLGGAECGDIIVTINEGFNRLHGDGLSTAEGYAQTSVTPVFLAAGEDIKEEKITDRVIRQVDVAPTIAEILGVRKPEQCEGAPVYQILKK